MNLEWGLGGGVGNGVWDGDHEKNLTLWPSSAIKISIKRKVTNIF